MLNVNKLADIMNIIFEKCEKCPLEKICDTDCSLVWKYFLESKVKEDGVEK